ncbi:carbohydrate kinase family protein [Candidatus Gottesmanbacteria bacterium]|nr:carbohydrate kinase family protein [Candidatus Gottesmanbacteria bacterium]
MNVVVTGSLGYDYIMDFPGRFADRIMPEKIHKISLSFFVETLSKQLGGTAGNIAYTLKLLGVEPYIVSSAGNDFAPYKTFLKKHKLSTAYIKEHKDVATGSYFVVTDQDDNQIGAFYSGATKYAKNLALKGVALKGSPFVVLAPTEPIAMKRYVADCRTLRLPYMYDPAFQIDQFAPDDLREGIIGAQILVGNDYEIALIEEKLAISHEELRVMVPIVITTLGSKGSVIETRKESIHIKPAKPKNTSDPTGAGDAYRAGFIAGYLKFHSKLSFGADELAICGQMGSVAAVYTVEKYGTQTHSFTKKAFIKRYQENFGGSPKI